MNVRQLLMAGAMGALALGAARPAHAITCDTLPNPVYVAGSSAVGPFIKAMGGPLSALATPLTIVYKSQGSCVGVNDIILDTTPTGACAAGACITGTAVYYDALGMQQMCDLPAAGQHVDVGISDVYALSCTGVTTVPADVTDSLGPIQAMTLVVPKASTQTAMTAEEAYFVFGFGGAMGMAAPWLDVTLQFIRNVGSGTQQMWSRAMGVPAMKMQGTDAGGSGGVITMVGGSTNAEPTVGILGADGYDVHRDTLTALAFRGFGQWAAYFPDSTATSFDKRNVRDGHYVTWGPIHMLMHTMGGMPVSANGKLFIDYIQGNPTTPPAPFDIVQIETLAHVVPSCAMTVQRTGEVGDLSLFDPPAPCGCFFDSLVGTPAASCTTCTTDASCGGTKKCRHGFCEAH